MLPQGNQVSVIVAVEESLFQLDPFEPKLQVLLLYVRRWVKLVREKGGGRGVGEGRGRGVGLARLNHGAIACRL